MVKDWEKYISRNPQRDTLRGIITDIAGWNLENYDVKRLIGYKNTYRLRVWKIRIIFSEKEGEYYIEAVDTRGDIYKRI